MILVSVFILVLIPRSISQKTIYLSNMNMNFQICLIVSSSNDQDQICLGSHQLGALLKIIINLSRMFK